MFGKLSTIPLNLHCWGGFGSQLNVAYLALQLRAKNESRKLVVHLHSSGVTPRGIELPFKELKLDIKFVDDFVRNNSRNLQSPNQIFKSAARLRKIALQIVKLFLNSIHIVVEVNTSEDLKQITPWTLAVRGHYSYLNIEPEIITKLYKTLFVFHSTPLSSASELLIHLRLGDLLTLNNKNPISQDRLYRLIEATHFDRSSINILSDSNPQMGLEYLALLASKYNVIIESKTPIETIIDGLSAKIFIGTNSKVSIWISIFRACILGKESFLPDELRIPSLLSLNKILFY
jgi:hypothetical protein